MGLQDHESPTDPPTAGEKRSEILIRRRVKLRSRSLLLGGGTKEGVEELSLLFPASEGGRGEDAGCGGSGGGRRSETAAAEEESEGGTKDAVPHLVGGRSLFFLFLASRLPGKGGGGRSPSKQKGGSLGSRERGLLLLVLFLLLLRRRAKTHGAKKKMRERET